MPGRCSQAAIDPKKHRVTSITGEKSIVVRAGADLFIVMSRLVSRLRLSNSAGSRIARPFVAAQD